MGLLLRLVHWACKDKTFKRRWGRSKCKAGTSVCTWPHFKTFAPVYAFYHWGNLADNSSRGWNDNVCAVSGIWRKTWLSKSCSWNEQSYGRNQSHQKPPCRNERSAIKKSKSLYCYKVPSDIYRRRPLYWKARVCKWGWSRRKLWNWRRSYNCNRWRQDLHSDGRACW